jgi:hypothetical protein
LAAQALVLFPGQLQYTHAQAKLCSVTERGKKEKETESSRKREKERENSKERERETTTCH